MGRNRLTTKDGYDPKDLLQYAEDHLASARILFRSGFRCLDSAGYLSHLGIELLLKSLLLNRFGQFPKEHDLLRLLNEIQEAGIGAQLSEGDLETLERINAFADVRYPNPEDPVQIGTGDWNSVESLHGALLALLPDEVKTPPPPDASITKGGRVLMTKPTGKRTG